MAELIIVGAGVVGLSCAWSAQRRGFQVTLVDRDFEGDRASHGNAGAIAVSECAPLNLSGLGLRPLRWLLDPLGPLAVRASHAPKLLPWFLALRKVAEPANYLRIANALAALNKRSLRDFEAVLADTGMGGDLHKRGALTVYETSQAFSGDAEEWRLKRALGVRWRSVDAAELQALEPNLAPVFQHSVMLEDWAHIDDPQRIVMGLRERVRALGAQFVTGSATSLNLGNASKPAVDLEGGQSVVGDKVVVAGGAWSARLAKTIGDRALLESERGYNTTLPASASLLNREVIFAEHKFVATPLAIGLRIGGAAEFAGLEAAPNYRRSDALLWLARKYLLGLDESNPTQWMGHRPATPDSLPVIGASPKNASVLYAFGHGHLGLTQSATTGELIGNILANEKTPIDMSPYAIERF
ncbi:NAD(P)/FAD-dependent oxidoreductase [Verminephrobacter aporrectodeae]|uniref:NAD(P)/FAD-dependent oxidoreductase n=1 Tax=Verminephrobacter aporrectodeae TaxID=1110389 RepID=UPI0002375032|nr:FAD-dependent oxidoreductase [Verminephrobacter aporrectodeae]MCW8164099.1 FAD-dependent oxidoreductase [Verminephrobacter aporrectodeae subsp. tuberculatae]MCW8168244.1 FAD-dependent oxidoreductase [Verminephrobacter aporrectodeae subsp. tuberculatae]MCW8174805.1 FAD-dependent oxidoreductase [Verminephrobacter aporrectodeae subsp. tuberculatae]MCW8197560.1 FAD-dependent oxidoreductase [Verminephrobacter aporrectodeae subsp. tuberculatae]MCW8202453.1 FAD-dependent oxidoreductase [Verminephr